MSETAILMESLKERKPLIYHITNMVTAGECANITLMAGGLPVMAPAREEAEEMVMHAGALVLNIGTLDPRQVEAMLTAGRKANELGLPVVLDPVGAGATTLRTESAQLLLTELRIDVVKGNAAEIAVLAGGKGEIRGVESLGVSGDIIALAAALAEKSGAVTAVTGAVDLITDGKTVVEIANGHPLLGTVVGTGCMAASLIGCYTAVSADRLQGTTAALTVFNVAGEMAAERAALPGSFKTELFNCLYCLTPQEVGKREKTKKGGYTQCR